MNYKRPKPLSYTGLWYILFSVKTLFLYIKHSLEAGKWLAAWMASGLLLKRAREKLDQLSWMMLSNFLNAQKGVLSKLTRWTPQVKTVFVLSDFFNQKIIQYVIHNFIYMEVPEKKFQNFWDFHQRNPYTFWPRLARTENLNDVESKLLVLA